MGIDGRVRGLATAFLDAHRGQILEGLAARLKPSGAQALLPVHEALLDLARAGIRDPSCPGTVADVSRVVAGADIPSVLTGQMDLWALLHESLRQVEGPHNAPDAFHFVITLTGDAIDGVIEALVILAQAGSPPVSDSHSMSQVPLNRRPFIELGRVHREFRALNRLTSELLGGRNSAQMFEALERGILDTFHLRSLTIAVVDHEEEAVEVVRACPANPLTSDPVGWRFDLSHPDILCHVARTGRVEVIDGWDARYHERVTRADGGFSFRQRPRGYNEGHTAFFLPISAGEQIIGVVATGAAQASREIVLREIDRMQPFLSQVGATLSSIAEIAERRQAEEEVRQQFRRIGLLNQIVRAIAERQDLRSIFCAVLQHLEDHLPVDFCGVFLLSPEGDALTVAARGPRSETLAAGLGASENVPIPVEKTDFGPCLKGETVYVPDMREKDELFPQRLARAGLLSAVKVPLIVEERVIGVLGVARRQADGFSGAEGEFLRTLAEHVALAARSAQLYQNLQGAYDDLRQTQQAVMQQERLKALGQMASGIAHDINNALSPVLGYAQMLLLDEERLSQEQVQYLNIIQRSARDIVQIVERMRAFYRPRMAQEALFPVVLNDAVKQVIDLTRPRWRDMPQERGVVIEIQTDLQEGLPAVMGVESEVREALTNLIFNAVDAMPQGGTLKITTRQKTDRDETEKRRNGETGKKGKSERESGRVGEWEKDSSPIPPFSHSPTPGGGRWVEVVAEDTGVGMDEETRQRCLEPFYSTKGDLGTGLGLAMVFGTMQRHEGRIEVESEAGRGTTVRLIFPVRRPGVRPGALPEKVDRYPGPSLRILCIDDEPLLRGLMKRMLEKDGHTAEAADGGQAGIDAFRAARGRGEPFDVVITDVGMPYVGGREVARAVKQESPDTPVILLTGWGSSWNEEGELPAQADYLLNKPPEVHALRRALEQVCAGKGRGE